MRREKLPVERLTLWAHFNDVTLTGVKIQDLAERGLGLIATSDRATRAGEDAILMTVPQKLVLSLETVWIYAKADLHLRQVLEAVDYSRVHRLLKIAQVS